MPSERGDHSPTYSECIQMHFPTCCLAIMGSMTSAICLDNLFHLSSFSLWHCCSTRMNISNTWTRKKTKICVFYDSMLFMLESIYDHTWWYCTSLSSMDTTTSFCVSSSLPASALFEPLNTNRSWTIGCRAGIAVGERRVKIWLLTCHFMLLVMDSVPPNDISLGHSGPMTTVKMILRLCSTSKYGNILQCNVYFVSSHHVWQPSCRLPWCRHTAELS